MGQHLLCTWLLNIELQKWIILLFKLRRLAHPNTIGFTVTLVLRRASHSTERERKCTRLATWVPLKGWFSGSQHRPASSLPSSFYTIYGQRGMAPGRTVNPCGSETSLFINEGSLLGLALLPSNPWHLKSWQHSCVDFGATRFVSRLSHRCSQGRCFMLYLEYMNRKSLMTLSQCRAAPTSRT